MIKRVLYFGNPASLSTKDCQVVIRIGKDENAMATHTVPIEDIGVMILDSPRITLTHALLNALLENNCAVISCDGQHLPSGLMLPLASNTLQSERYRFQLSASLPLKKQLWQQTVSVKIQNQMLLLKSKGVEVGNMRKWMESVKSGDADNLEARAAVYYWSKIFSGLPGFIRDRDGDSPNALLNYGYAILRAIVARSLVAAGLLPTLGIFHRNRYNAYCLADDIMEPYRPYVDEVVDRLTDSGRINLPFDKETKSQLLSLPVRDVRINQVRSPLMVAVQTTANSLYKCFSGESRKIIYPEYDVAQ